MRRLICTLMISMAAALAASGQSQGLGIYQSIKGLGVSFDFAHGKDTGFDSLNLLADMGEVMLGRSSKPGVKLIYSHLYEFAGFRHPLAFVTMYAGPGISAGRVWDTGHSNFGWEASACGSFGCRIDFDRGVSIRAGLTAELGAFIHEDAGLHLYLYRNGLFHSAFPFIIISMGFGR